MSLGIGSGLHSGFIGEEENRWMKKVFTTNQTSYSVPMMVTGFGTGWTGAVDDTYTLKYDLYLDGTYSGATGGAGTVAIQMKMEGNTDSVTVAVPLDTITSMEQSSTGNVDSNAIIMQSSSTSSYPDANDAFYVRDLVIEVYGADGVLKIKKEWDFKVGGSATALDGTGVVSSYSMEGGFTQTFGENPLA